MYVFLMECVYTSLTSDEREGYLTYAEYPGAKSILSISLCVQLTLMSGLGNSYLTLIPHSEPLFSVVVSVDNHQGLYPEVCLHEHWTIVVHSCYGSRWSLWMCCCP